MTKDANGFTLSRWVKKGKFDSEKQPMKLDPKERIYFLQEDPENAKTGEGAIPWRRVYEPAQNSQILDRLFLAGSLIVVTAWFALKALADTPSVISEIMKTGPHWFLFSALVVLLIIGAKISWKNPNLPTIIAKVFFTIVGIAFAIVWFVYSQSEILANLEALSSNLVPTILCGLLIVGASWAIVEWYARKYKPAAVV